MPDAPYTLEQAEEDIADLRGQVDQLDEVHTQADGGLVPNTPAAGIVTFSGSSQQKYVSAADGNAYNTGRMTAIPGSATSLTSSYQTVVSAPLGTGGYRIRAQLLLNPSVSGGTPSYQYAAASGLVLSHGRLACLEVYMAAAMGVGDWVGDGTMPGAFTSANSVGAGLNDRIVTFDGYLVVSTAGTLNVQAKLSSGSASIVQYGTYLDVMPVT